MTSTFNIYEAKTKLSQLVERAASGEEIIIARAGKARAKLVSIAENAAPRKPGSWKGKGWIGPDFDDPLPDDLLRAFKGEDE